MVVNPLIWNGVNLRVLRGQLLIKSSHCWMRSRVYNRALAKPDIQLPGICVAQSLVRIPNSKVVAHARVKWPPSGECGRPLHPLSIPYVKISLHAAKPF